jgi:alkanesulfonate monooxygenase SsuD/methylene tetrahydromethanopterin reductase-like flavin-dependent oxidoreductase (luciferase family)
MPNPLRFGVFVPQGWKMDLVEIEDPVAQYEAMTAVAKAADAEPTLDSIWVYDHFHTVPRADAGNHLRVLDDHRHPGPRHRAGQGRPDGRLQRLPQPGPLRQDRLDRRRRQPRPPLRRIGAGWYEHEWRAYGYGFPDIPERMRMFREGVEVIHAMWTDTYASYQGRHYTLDGAINEPKSVQQPHPPLWIGGGGEQVTLKLVAQYGDACNVGGGNPETCRQKLEVLKRHCDAVGRDYDSIVKSTSIDLLLLEDGADRAAAIEANRGPMDADRFYNQFWVGTADEIGERMQGLVDAGIRLRARLHPARRLRPHPRSSAGRARCCPGSRSDRPRQEQIRSWRTELRPSPPNPSRCAGVGSAPVLGDARFDSTGPRPASDGSVTSARSPRRAGLGGTACRASSPFPFTNPLRVELLPLRPASPRIARSGGRAFRASWRRGPGAGWRSG